MSLQIEMDGKGNMVLRPVTDLITGTVANIAVVLGIQYRETPEEAETARRSIQFVLTSQQCLDLAEMLTKQAQCLQNPLPSGKPPN